MDIHRLRVFQAVIKAGGFTRASEQMYLSQSTISQHVKQLEEELGCPLFLRVGKRVLVTDAGNLLLQYAERIFNDLKNAEMQVREMRSLRRGRVRLGVGATTLTYRLPSILADYNRRFPEIELIVRTATTEVLLQALKTQTIDLAIVMSPHPEPGIAITLLDDEELVLVLHRDHPLARTQMVKAADLASLRFILYERRTLMQNLIDEYFEWLGVTPCITMELENIEAVKALVRAGLGASILPLCAVTDRRLVTELRVIRVAERPLFRTLGLAMLDAPTLPNTIQELASSLATRLTGRQQRTGGRLDKK